MLVSITDAAARLAETGDAVDRTSLSRYLKQHAAVLPLVQSGRQRLVEWDDLVAHRRENVRLSGGTAAPAEITSDPPSTAGRRPTRFAGSEVDATGRLRMAQARDAELDLAERLKQVTPVGEVDRAGRDAVALMRAAMEREVEPHADRLSLRHGWDARAVRLALKDFAKAGIDVFHREVMTALDRMREEGEAPAVGTD